jgi:very-short-patch-repair endonuclease
MNHRLATGALHRVFPSVLSIVDPLLEPLAHETAALLYAGDDAVLSHRTAAALWGITTAPPFVAITIANRHVRSQPELHIHRVEALDIRDVRIHQGLPVTAPARTLIDLAGASDTATTERALNEARVQKLVTDDQIEAALDRCPLRSGVGTIRAIMNSEPNAGFTRQEAERRLRTIIRDARLPSPVYNVNVCGYEVDAFWTTARLVLEVDGFATHGHPAAFERDRRKDQDLVAAGYQVLRTTWRQITGEPLVLVARIAQALTRADRA